MQGLTDSKPVTAHLVYQSPTTHFLDNILWLSLRFFLARNSSVYVRSLKTEAEVLKMVWCFHMSGLSVSDLSP